MYLQVMDQVRQRVALGSWPTGTKLPSIRELAVALSVSVITIKRAYLELERSGVIVTAQGKGSWVAESADQHQFLQEELNGHLQKAATLAQSLDLSEAQLVSLLTRHLI